MRAGLFLLEDGETEGLIASYDSHEFRPHYHDTWAVGVALAGEHRLWYEGDTWQVRPGDAIVLPPGSLHTGAPGGRGTWTIAMLFPSASVLERTAPARQATPIVRAPRLALPLAAELCRVGAGPGSSPRRLLDLTAAAIALAENSAPVPRQGSDPRIRDARARLTHWSGHAPSIPALAAEFQLHPSYLSTLFRAAYGIGPYGYWLAGRVEQARRQLRAGARPTELAHALGFADQSHFTRTFRRAVGLTPGAYRDGLATAASHRSPDPILKLF